MPTIATVARPKPVYLDDFNPSSTDASSALESAIDAAIARETYIPAAGTGGSAINIRTMPPIVLTGGKTYKISQTVKAYTTANASNVRSVYLTSDGSRAAVLEPASGWTQSNFAVDMLDGAMGQLSGIVFNGFDRCLKVGDADRTFAGYVGTNINAASYEFSNCRFISSGADDDVACDMYNRSANISFRDCAWDNFSHRCMIVRSVDVVSLYGGCRIVGGEIPVATSREQYTGLIELNSGQLFLDGVVGNPRVGASASSKVYDDGAGEDYHAGWVLQRDYPHFTATAGPSSTSTVLVASGSPGWTTDYFSGDTLHNLTTGNSATIAQADPENPGDSNTASTITLDSAITGGLNSGDSIYVEHISTSVWSHVRMVNCHWGAEHAGMTPLIYATDPYDGAERPNNLLRPHGFVLDKTLCGSSGVQASGKPTTGEGPDGDGVAPAVLLVKQPNLGIVKDCIFPAGYNVAMAYPLNDAQPAAYLPTATKRSLVRAEGNYGGVGSSLGSYQDTVNWYPRDLAHRVISSGSAIDLFDSVNGGDMLIVDAGANVSRITGGAPGMELDLFIRSKATGLRNAHTSLDGRFQLQSGDLTNIGGGIYILYGAASGKLVRVRCVSLPDLPDQYQWVQVGTANKLPVETASAASPALSLTIIGTEINSASNAVAATLADGTRDGQRKVVEMVDATNSSTLSVTNHATSSPEVFTFSATTHYAELEWDAANSYWTTVRATAAT